MFKKEGGNGPLFFFFSILLTLLHRVAGLKPGLPATRNALDVLIPQLLQGAACQTGPAAALAVSNDMGVFIGYRASDFELQQSPRNIYGLHLYRGLDFMKNNLYSFSVAFLVKLIHFSIISSTSAPQEIRAKKYGLVAELPFARPY
jgi:hypothetical protein